MRINLNFKDSTIRKLSASEFEIVFDLSNMIKPRLSPDARMYIEYFTICEFLDEALGSIEGDLKGSFELRCPNLPSHDYDTSMGNNGGTILFSAPLENYRTYTNSNPMFLSNFKIDQGFLSNRLVFILSVFDRFGKPYDSSKHLIQSVNTSAGPYLTYQAEMVKFNDLNNELEKSKNKIEYAKSLNKSYESSKKYYRGKFDDASTKLKTALQDYTNDASNTLRSRVIAEQLLIFLSTETLNSYKNFFEHTFVNNASLPYTRVLSLLKQFYSTFQEYHQYDTLFDNSTELVNLLQNSGQFVITDFIPAFNPHNINIKDDKKIVEYTDSSGAKKGEIEIEYFNSVDESRIGVVIYDLKQTSTDLLANGDKIIIKQDSGGTNYFETSQLSTFKYYISHSENFESGKKRGIGFKVNIARNQKFALEVTRNAGSYDYKFLENESGILNIPTKNFVVGDQITIHGNFLGGAGTTNDLVIEVTEIDALLPDEDIQLTNYRPFIDARDLGTLDIEVTKPNNGTTSNDEDYIIKTKDFSNTKNFAKNETFTIKGTELNGESPKHDLTVTVDEVYGDVIYTINESASATHSIKQVIIDQNVAVIKDSSGAELTGASKPSFSASVTSANGQYILDMGVSENFEANSTVFISGQHLTGEDGTNDLEFTFSAVTGSGGIDESTITFTPQNRSARNAKKKDGTTGFELQVKQQLRSDKYDTISLDIDNIQDGDEIVINGDQLGGDISTNKLEIKFGTTADGDIGFVESGTAAILDNEYGEIKAISHTGKGRFIPVEGKIVKSQKHATSKNPIDLTGITMPQLEITITDDLLRSVNTIIPELNTQETVANTAKDAVVSTTASLISHLGPRQEEKLKCMNMSLVLYDEVPEYKQASQDAIKGNTYSQLNTPQFKRI